MGISTMFILGIKEGSVEKDLRSVKITSDKFIELSFSNFQTMLEQIKRDVTADFNEATESNREQINLAEVNFIDEELHNPALSRISIARSYLNAGLLIFHMDFSIKTDCKALYIIDPDILRGIENGKLAKFELVDGTKFTLDLSGRTNDYKLVESNKRHRGNDFSVCKIQTSYSSKELSGQTRLKGLLVLPG